MRNLKKKVLLYDILMVCREGDFMDIAGLRAAIAAAQAEKAKAEKEKMLCEKELESCMRLLKCLQEINEDYLNCTTNMNQTINHLANGYVVDGVGVGVDSLSSRNNKIKNHKAIVERTINKTNQRIIFLRGRIDELRLKIAQLAAQIASLQAQLAAALAEAARRAAEAANNRALTGYRY